LTSKNDFALEQESNQQKLLTQLI